MNPKCVQFLGEQVGENDTGEAAWSRFEMAIVVTIGLGLMLEGSSNFIEKKIDSQRLKKRLANRSKVEMFFETADTTQSFQLSREDVKALYAQENLEYTDEIFDRYDIDGDGSISRHEFDDMGEGMLRLQQRRKRKHDTYSILRKKRAPTPKLQVENLVSKVKSKSKSKSKSTPPDNPRSQTPISPKDAVAAGSAGSIRSGTPPRRWSDSLDHTPPPLPSTRGAVNSVIAAQRFLRAASDTTSQVTANHHSEHYVAIMTCRCGSWCLCCADERTPHWGRL